jgi:NAD(P)-dependent dehydrogenase (short-subunit alcohol dehydrogenase family)
MQKRKTVLVTDASQGIGAATVRVFLNRGYQVVATSRSASKAGFAPSPDLAIVDGDIGMAATAENVTHRPQWPDWLDRPRRQQRRNFLGKALSEIHRR